MTIEPCAMGERVTLAHEHRRTQHGALVISATRPILVSL